MNKKIKRALSSALAFVMLCSCMMVANVSNVMAAVTATATAGTDASIKAIFADTNSYLYYYSMPSVSAAADTEVTATDGTHTGSVKLTSGTVSFSINGTTLTGQKASSKAGNNVVKGVKAGETVVFDLYMNADKACTMSFKKNSTAKTSPDVTLDLGSTRAPYQISVDVDEDCDLYFYNDQQLAIANIGVKTATPAVGGDVSLAVTGGENGTTSVTVAGTALESGATAIAANAGDEVVVSATPNDGYGVTVTVNDKEVKLTNNSYTFKVSGDAAIIVTYEESKEICKYNISKTGITSLEDGKITFDSGYALATPFVTPVYLADGATETPFTQGALPGGSSQGINATMNAGDRIGVYYTTSDSKYTTTDQSKSGYATVTNSAGATVAEDSNTANKNGNCAYYFEYQATTTDTFKIKASSNRFVVYGIDYTPVTSAEYILTTAPYEGGDYTSAITSADGKLVVNASSFNGTQHGVVFGTGNTFTLDVDGDSTILLGGCSYSNGSVVVTDAAGNTVVSSTATKTNGCYAAGSDNNLVKFIYKGEATKLTFTFTGTTYIPYISVAGFVVPTVTVGITLKDGIGAALAGVPVNLKKGAGVLTQTTNDAGLAQFTDILPDEYQVYTALYTLSQDTVNVTSDTYNFEITATKKDISELPATASVDDGKLYVGFVDSDGDYTGTIYSTIQAAHDAASGDADIVLGKGTYYEQLKITKNTTITGAGTVADTIITYDDKSSTSQNGFHGDTIAVLGKINSFNASNITIQNSTPESAKENATAMSVYVNDASVTLNFTNCVFDSFCDTIYTGKTNNSNTWVMNNCEIRGYQDTICGSGDVTLNNCTWDVYTTSNATARLFVPTGNSVDGFVSDMVANNLKVTNSLGSGTGYAFFARGWGQGSVKLVGKANVVINGYTDEENAVVADGAASNGYTSAIGFDTKLVGTDTGETLTSMVWIARENATDNYKTTYADFNSANAFQSAEYEADNEAYRIIGKINAALLNDANVAEVGFAVYNADGSFIGNMSDSTVYHETADATDYYTVNFATGVDTTKTTSLKPYVKYNSYDIEGNTSENIVYTAAN